MQLVMGTLHANAGDDTEYFCSELVAHGLQVRASQESRYEC